MNPKREIATRLTKDFADKGMLVEGGWRAYEFLTGLLDASPLQRSECRKAFYAGCRHLFGSLLTFLESGTEPTDKDMDRMTALHKELEAWTKEMEQTNAFKKPK